MDPLDDLSSNEEQQEKTNSGDGKKVERSSADFNDSIFDSSDEEGQVENDSSDLESLTKGRGKNKKIKKDKKVGRLRKGKIEKQKSKKKGEEKEMKAKGKPRKEKKRERQDDFSTDESDLDYDIENIDEELRDLQADVDELSSIEDESDEGGRRRRKRRKVGDSKPKKKKKNVNTTINDDNFIDDADDDQEILQEYRDQQEFSDEDDSYSDDPDDDKNSSSLRKGKAKKKNKIYKEEKSVTLTKEETEIDRALKAATSSKKKNIKMKPEQIEEYSRRVVTEMREASRLDKENYQNGKLAIAKMTTLKKVLPHLRNRDLHLRLLDEDHILDAIGDWIKPLPDNSLPAYNIRHELLKILSDLPCEVSHLTADRTDIGKIVKKLSEHPDETIDNKKVLKNLIENWLRIITGRSGNNFRRPMDRENGSANHRQKTRDQGRESYAVLEPGQGKTKSDVYIPINENDIKIPMRAGFNYEVMPSMNHPSIRKKKKGASADEAIEVTEPTRRQHGNGKGSSRLEELKKKFKRR